ncbi:MAG: AAA family ATPase [Sandaracinaceae bacterium]|nr:AAA family ATPase [Sandaracinaceae bacterium]
MACRAWGEEGKGCKAFSEGLKQLLEEVEKEADTPAEFHALTLAWELARELGQPDEPQLLLRLLLVLIWSHLRGATAPLLKDLLEHRFLADRNAEERILEALKNQWARIVGCPEDSKKPIAFDGQRLALRRFAWLDGRAAKLTAERVQRASVASFTSLSDQCFEEELNALEARPLEGGRGPIRLTPKQREAVLKMAKAPFVLLTGGPGTGKTSIVAQALRLLLRVEARRKGKEDLLRWLSGVALGAPTGKAADRMGEALRRALEKSDDPLDKLLLEHLRPPMTIHRLLGQRRSGEFIADFERPLSEHLVIVDEASMLGIELFHQLIGALLPQAHLVLIGDPDQLPPVEAGAVLRDLLQSRIKGITCIQLDESHRMDPKDPHGRSIFEAARRCLEGQVPLQPSEEEGPRLVGRGGAHFVCLKEEKGLEAILKAWAERHFLGDSLDGVERGSGLPFRVLERFSRQRVLCGSRQMVERVDRFLSEYVSWRRRQPRTHPIQPGDPLIVVRNDYDLSLWNGDFGVAWRDSRGQMWVAFMRLLVKGGDASLNYPFSLVSHLVERSYAMTVHRAQGSEYDEVLLILLDDSPHLVKRELVYTAISRARRSLLLVSTPDRLNRAVTQKDTRSTWFEEALRRAMEKMVCPGSVGD